MGEHLYDVKRSKGAPRSSSYRLAREKHAFLRLLDGWLIYCAPSLVTLRTITVGFGGGMNPLQTRSIRHWRYWLAVHIDRDGLSGGSSGGEAEMHLYLDRAGGLLGIVPEAEGAATNAV